jgi:hypothetical protein
MKVKKIERVRDFLPIKWMNMYLRVMDTMANFFISFCVLKVDGGVFG